MSAQMSMSLLPSSPVSAQDTAAADTQRAAVAKRNREQMPEVSAFVDEMRKIAPDLKVRWAYENGVELNPHRRPSGITDVDLNASVN